jgi:translation elongation factor EF-1alpha
LLSFVDQNTGTVIKEIPKFLKQGQFANISIKLEKRKCLELFNNYRNMGRVAIRRENHTITAGTIVKMLE